MPNGVQIAQRNLEAFDAWEAERRAASDWTDYVNRATGQLRRSEIAKECGFNTAALRQNPRLRDRLAALEAKLKASGVLPVERRPREERAEQQRTSQARSLDKQRIKALEERNAAQSAKIRELEGSLKRYALFEAHLAETGRLIKP